MDLQLSNELAAPLSKLLSVMAEGESMAEACAARQARAANDLRSRRFFSMQARHERFHAFLFRRAASRLAPCTRSSPFRSPGLQRYAQRLDLAIARQRWDEVVIGQQLVLEDLGDLVLSELDREMDRRRAGFSRTRSLVLRQERAHHHFGTQWIERRIRNDQIRIVHVRDHAEQYLQLADLVLQDVSSLLEDLEADPGFYRSQIRERMPAWATGVIA